MRLVLALCAVALGILPAHAQRSFEIQQPQGSWQQPGAFQQPQGVWQQAGPFQQPQMVWLQPRPFQQLNGPWQVPGTFPALRGETSTRPFTQSIVEGWERGLRGTGNAQLDVEKSDLRSDGATLADASRDR